MKKRSTGLKVTAGIRAGGFTYNHNSTALKIRSGIKAGRGIFVKNHNRTVDSL
jgi:hypothetical protein